MEVSGASERSKVFQGLVERLTQAADMEGWGLIVEAADEYQRTARKMVMAAGDRDKCFSMSEKEFLQRVAQGLQVKASSLQDLSSVQEPSSSSHVDVKRIIAGETGNVPALQESLRGGGVSESTLADLLPPAAHREPTVRPPHTQVSHDDDYSTAAADKAGSLVPRVSTLPGHTYLTITVDRIGVKDPQNYIDPFITVSVKTMGGGDIESPQDTPVSNQREASALLFGVAIEIQKAVDEIPQGSAIFLELKHYKPKKTSVSTRCFSFMEMDEIKPGKAVLEIYKKPTDFCRKKLSLLSVKPLYMHLTLALHKS